MVSGPAGESDPRPQGAYVLVASDGHTAFTAGMTPRVDGELLAVGHVGSTVPVEVAGRCAELAARNALRGLAAEIGGLDSIARCLRLTVFVACAPDFTAHARVADHASGVLLRELGPRGEAVRTSVGVAALPGGAPVEVELTVSLAAT